MKDRVGSNHSGILKRQPAPRLGGEEDSINGLWSVEAQFSPFTSMPGEGNTGNSSSRSHGTLLGNRVAMARIQSV